MYTEFSKHLKNSTVPNKQHKKIENQGIEEILSLKGNTFPNKKTQGSIQSMARKRGISQRTLAIFFITETTIGKIVSTIPIPRILRQNKKLEGRERKSREQKD